MDCTIEYLTSVQASSGADPPGTTGNPGCRGREPAEPAAGRGEFLATVSHELRTPLTSASSLVELLADGELAAPVSAEIVHALRRNVDRLAATVEDLLLLVRIETGQLPLHRRPVDTGALLGDLLGPLWTGRAGAGDSPPVRVLGDPYWLARMIGYLLSGLLPTGEPDTRTAHGAVHDGHWTLTVTGDSLHTKADRPAGLGVVLARAIAERHGGGLLVEHDGELTRVEVTLPVS